MAVALTVALAVGWCAPSVLAARGGGTAEPASRAAITAPAVGAWRPEIRPANRPAEGERRTLVVVATSDLHGWITHTTLFPDSRPGGLAHLAPVIAELRREAPGMILLDGGDTVQGAPNLTLLRLRGEGEVPPVLRLMNRLGYDAMALGNHDLEQGRSAMARWAAQASFPWLSANMVSQGGEPVLPPYRIIERQGLRVGVLGLITPGTPAWVDRSLLRGLRFIAMEEAARRWLPVLKQIERADVVIGLVHAGVNGRYDRRVAVGAGLPLPNAAGLLADEVLGLDLIVSGHAHRLSPRRPRNGDSSFAVPVVEPGARGEGVAVARIRLVGRAGQWRVEGLRRSTLRAAIRPDPEALAEAGELLSETRAWLAAPTAVRFTAFPEPSAFRRCAGELSHRAALAESSPPRRAEGSTVPREAAREELPGAYSLLPMVWRAGAPAPDDLGRPVRRAHLYRWMRYGNPLVQAELTARQMALLLGPYARRVRELNARYSAVLFPGGLEPRIAPHGTEVVALLPQGGTEPLPPHERVRVWLTNYHWNGGGGLAARALLHSSQVVRRTGGTLREAVFRLLSEPGVDLPRACRAFLAAGN